MKAVYLESSSVLHWLLGQAAAAEVRRTIDQAEIVLTSLLTFTETERALVRAEHEGSLNAGDAQRVRGLLNRAKTSWMCMAISDDVLARAARPFPVEPIRTLDAIHLATALEFVKSFPVARILSYDRRVLDNATALGVA